jgi:thiol-disulfide isomerase/thioredoxin
MRRVLPALLLSGLAVACVLAVSVVGRAEPTAVAPPPSGAVSTLMVGTQPPELDTRRVAGTDDVTLARLRGRVVVLDFWATWCGPCRMIMPELDRLSTQYHSQGLSIVGIAQESEGDILRHLASEPVGYTVARDIGHTMHSYGVRAIPMLVVVDRRGNVARVFTGIGPSDMHDLQALVAMLVQQRP